MPAPTQYIQLEYCPYWIISPINDSGIVKERPTVTTRGEVRSMAYAQHMSLTKEDTELSCSWLASTPDDDKKQTTHENNAPDLASRRPLKRLNLCPM